MGSVSNPGLTSLFQVLSNSSPGLASPNIQSALENASPTDIAEISVAATQLQGIDELFGISDNASNDPASELSSILANLQSASMPQTAGSESTGATTAATSALSPADQLTDWQTAAQGEALNSLFGTTPNGPDLIDLLG